MFTVIATCTSTRTVEPVVRVGDLPTDLTMQEAFDLWKKELESNKPSTTPAEMYRGLGFLTLSNIIRTFPIESAKIVTGGQGLIGVDQPIVPYDFTADVKEHPNIHQKVTKEPFSQTHWWKMINTWRGSPTPIADIINKATEPSSVIISCPKIFLRYIASDILSADPSKANVFRILLSASSIGSVPMQLRPFIVPFDRSSVANLPGNRNDVTHRAAYMFIDAMVKDPSLRELSPYEQRRRVFGEEGGIYTTNKVDVPSILKARPELLELPVEDAYKALYKEFGSFGGRNAFHSAFMRAKGIEVRGEADDDAVSILQSLGLKPKVNESVDKKDDTLQLASVFVDAVRKVGVGIKFDSNSIVAWAEKYCSAKSIAVPDELQTALKAVFFLKKNAPVLGLEVTGNSEFCLAEDVED